MSKKNIVSLAFLLHVGLLFSQAGYGVYSFLDLPVSARLAALGGSNVSLEENDLSFAFRNPSMLKAETDNMISLNIANYLADIKFGSAMYSKNFGKKNYFAVGVQFVDYGIFKETNEINDILGDFTAKDIALNIIYARPLTNKITVGGTLKPIFSTFERYTSVGVALDAGVNYNNEAKFFSAGLVLRNIGTQIKGYYSEEDGQHFEPLPFDIQAGITKKLTHAPLRLSLTLHNLQHWDLTHNFIDSGISNINSSAESTDIKFVDMAFRHSIISAEFVPSKNFYLAASYNHRRHQELKMPGFKSLAGFSFGGGIKLYKFQVGFGMSQFQVGNYSYQFSINTSLNEFRL
jgi:hypothetical protein